MKEFIEKLIARLEENIFVAELHGFGWEGQRVCNLLCLGDVKDIAEEHEDCFILCSNHCETYDKEKHYCPKWCQTIRDTVAELKEEYFENAMIDGQYCWQTCGATEHCKECNRLGNGYTDYYENYDFMAEEHNGGWIPCSERLPEVEAKVLILAKRKYRDGSFKNIITTAMYEDGTVLENDSRWRWEDIEGEWDEGNDCYIISQGWWEDKMYNADGELNHAVDDEVIAWQQLPEPYKQKGE